MLHPAFAIALCGLSIMNQQAPPRETSLRAHELRCEYRTDPLGVDAPRPRLSWKVQELDPSIHGQRQSAHQILVASTPELLAREVGDLWDPGKVASRETICIEYAGRTLRSGERCHWKVRVWDKDGQRSAWSAPATWMMGVLRREEWHAQWIGFDEPLASRPGPIDFGEARWIWSPEDPAGKAAEGECFFRKVLALPADMGFRAARLVITADDRFDLHLNGEALHVTEVLRDSWKRVAELDVTRRLRSGPNLLAVRVRNQRTGPAGLIARLVVQSREGREFALQSDSSWRCSKQAPTGWQAPGFDDGAWSAALQVAKLGEKPWQEKLNGEPLFLPPPRYLRRSFAVGRPVRRAVLHASALGIYEIHLNGARIGDDSFTPGWTDYEKRVHYNSYDVTDLVRAGENAIGAILADGWYAGYVGYKPEREHYGAATRLLAQLELEYDDGSREVLSSDSQWKAALGPLLEADFLMGERYDARREMPGWDGPGFDDAGWQPVVCEPLGKAVLEAYPAQTVGQLALLLPGKVTQPRPGIHVFDMGQNFAGVVRLKVKAEKGREITIRHAERLNPDGTIYTENLRCARATDVYICRGGGAEEEWQPRFTFHGLQYVEVEGLPGEPGPDTVVGVPLGSRTPLAGSFECSDPVVNKLVSNILWTQRMNFIDIPTDCPQRDERLGWTGDAQIYVRTATALCDVQAFFTKWLADLSDAQRVDGQFPMVAPLKVAGDDGGPGWADAGTICPWTIYEVYGDRRLLARHYEGMKRFIAFCEGRCTKQLLPPKEFHCFGDWVSIGADTPKDVIFTAYFAYSARLTARAAAALGEEADAARYEALFTRIKGAFEKAYIDAEGRIKGDTQCVYALAISFDLVDGERRAQAIHHLVERLAARSGHLSTGFLGTKDLMLALSKAGRDDLAYILLHNDTFPSWGFSIKNGATSIWERWNGWTPEEGFATPHMNSFAHYAFGAVGQWLFETVGGIDCEKPGFERIRIRPRPGGQLRFARARYESISGTIRCAWEREAGGLRLNVGIPANTTASLHLPTADPGAVRIDGGSIEDAPGLRLLRVENGEVVLDAEPGNYTFLIE